MPGALGRPASARARYNLVLLVTDEDLKEDTDYNNRQSHWDTIYDHGGRIIVDYGAGGTAEINSLITDMLAASSAGVALVPVISPLAYASIPVCQTLSPIVLSFGQRLPAIVRGDDANAGPALSCAVQAVGAYMPRMSRRAFSTIPPIRTRAAIPWTLRHPSSTTLRCSWWIRMPDARLDTTPSTRTRRLCGQVCSDPAGNPVCWRIHVKENQVVEPAEIPQMFKATIEVYGTGDALLDSRDVYFLVPPEFSGPGGPA
jgi:hypothetical protein